MTYPYSIFVSHISIEYGDMKLQWLSNFLEELEKKTYTSKSSKINTNQPGQGLDSKIHGAFILQIVRINLLPSNRSNCAQSWLWIQIIVSNYDLNTLEMVMFANINGGREWKLPKLSCKQVSWNPLPETTWANKLFNSQNLPLMAGLT